MPTKNNLQYALIQYTETGKYQVIEFEKDHNPYITLSLLCDFMGRRPYEIKKVFNTKRELTTFLKKVSRLAEKEKESKNGR